MSVVERCVLKRGTDTESGKRTIALAMNNENQNMSSPLVSVLIPTRNRANIVPETIDSVLRQTWGDFELVISNNHSKDNTAAVLEEYARRDSRIRLITPPEEFAMTDHWNWAWTQLKGIYGTFLSDDDLWEPTFLQTVVGLAQKHPEVDVVGTGFTHWHPSDPAKTAPREAKLAEFDGHIADPLALQLKYFLFHLNCSLIRRATFFEVGGYGPTIVGDSELWIKAALAGKKFYFTSESLLKYRVHEGQASDDQMCEYLANMVETLPKRPGVTWRQSLRLRRAAGGFWALAAKGKVLSGSKPSLLTLYANGIKACPWHPANWIGMAQTLLKQPATR